MKKQFNIFFAILILLFPLSAEKVYKEFDDGSGRWVYKYESWYEYDSMGNLIYEKETIDPNTFEKKYEYNYDSKGNIIYCKDSDGKES